MNININNKNKKNLNKNINTKNTKKYINRPPIVTIMGHVDHGKTSLLDYIRKTNIINEESGNITQHIGSYFVNTLYGSIAFLDTPGHQAFTKMRSRGVKCTDIIILVVSADEGVKLQTLESIQHTKNTNIPIIVAITKIDKKNCLEIDYIKKQLVEHDLTPEEWGGKTIFHEISSKTGKNINNLLESIILEAQLLELKASLKNTLEGVVLESRIDKGKGPIAKIIIKDGQLNVGDIILVGNEYGKVRSIIKDNNNVNYLGLSESGEILGLSGTPDFGSVLSVYKSLKTAKKISLLKKKNFLYNKKKMFTAYEEDNIFSNITQKKKKILNVIIKTDVKGSLEAIQYSIEEINNNINNKKKIKINIILGSIGNINDSDIDLAVISKAFIISFKNHIDSKTKKYAMKNNIKIIFYKIIYDIINDINIMIDQNVENKIIKNIIGMLVIKEIFIQNKNFTILGCLVDKGKILRNKKYRILRNNKIIKDNINIHSIRRFQEIVNEVSQKKECGIKIIGYNEIKIGDQIEVYEISSTGKK